MKILHINTKKTWMGEELLNKEFASYRLASTARD